MSPMSLVAAVTPSRVPEVPVRYADLSDRLPYVEQVRLIMADTARTLARVRTMSSCARAAWNEPSGARSRAPLPCPVA